MFTGYQGQFHGPALLTEEKQEFSAFLDYLCVSALAKTHGQIGNTGPGQSALLFKSLGFIGSSLTSPYALARFVPFFNLPSSLIPSYTMQLCR